MSNFDPSKYQKVELEQLPDLDGHRQFRLKVMRTTFETDDDRIIPLYRQTSPWFGDCVHTSSSGVVELADRLGWSVGETMCWCYGHLLGGHPHDAVDDLGTIYRICVEDLVAVHCGAKAWMRNMMLDGTWVNHVSAIGLAYWHAAWPGIKSPQHLFPGPSGNHAYRGIEVAPRKKDLKYEDVQYHAVATILKHRHQRVDYFVKVNSSGNSSRLVGHEDLIPFYTSDRGRWDRNGGWDPGARREFARWDWPKLYGLLKA